MFKRIAVSFCIASVLALSACQAEEDDLTLPENADDGSNNPPAVTPGTGGTVSASQLCAIPTLGPAIAEGAGSNCDDAEPSPISATQLCALPGIGPALVQAAGESCPDAGGGDSPISAGQLCVIPAIGEALVNAAGGTCGDAPSSSPLPAELSPTQLCAIPQLGPQLVSALGEDCSGAGGGTGLQTRSTARVCGSES